jgi:antitoxin YefM
MLVANISDFRKDIKKYFDGVVNDFQTLIINRGKDTVVVMSLEEYNSLNATHHEMSSEANIKWLDDSIKSMKSGKTVTLEKLED